MFSELLEFFLTKFTKNKHSLAIPIVSENLIAGYLFKTMRLSKHTTLRFYVYFLLLCTL